MLRTRPSMACSAVRGPHTGRRLAGCTTPSEPTREPISAASPGGASRAAGSTPPGAVRRSRTCSRSRPPRARAPQPGIGRATTESGTPAAGWSPKSESPTAAALAAVEVGPQAASTQTSPGMGGSRPPSIRREPEPRQSARTRSSPGGPVTCRGTSRARIPWATCRGPGPGPSVRWWTTTTTPWTAARPKAGSGAVVVVVAELRAAGSRSLIGSATRWSRSTSPSIRRWHPPSRPSPQPRFPASRTP